MFNGHNLDIDENPFTFLYTHLYINKILIFLKNGKTVILIKGDVLVKQ